MVAATTLTYPPISAQCHASGRPAGWSPYRCPPRQCLKARRRGQSRSTKEEGHVPVNLTLDDTGPLLAAIQELGFRIVAGGGEPVTGRLVPEAPAPMHSSVPSSATLRPESQAHSSWPAFHDAPDRARRNEAPTSSDRYTSLCLDTSDADPRLSQGEWAGAR